MNYLQQIRTKGEGAPNDKDAPPRGSMIDLALENLDLRKLRFLF